MSKTDGTICFFCKEPITKEEMVNEKVEMITGPNKQKIFTHKRHAGVMEEVEKLNGM